MSPPGGWIVLIDLALIGRVFLFDGGGCVPAAEGLSVFGEIEFFISSGYCAVGMRVIGWELFTK